MSRFPRMVAVGFPHHVVQRGNRRLDVFMNPADYDEYLLLLKWYMRKYGTSMLAYCLMNNHVHLLAKPISHKSLAKLMHSVALGYAKYFNRNYAHTGHLWECRYYSSIVDSDRYLWTVARYIEQNPRRANIVKREEEYPYSSARAHVTGSRDPVLSETLFDEGELQSYIDFLHEPIPDGEFESLKRSEKTGDPYGRPEFVQTMSR